MVHDAQHDSAAGHQILRRADFCGGRRPSGAPPSASAGAPCPACSLTSLSTCGHLQPHVPVQLPFLRIPPRQHQHAAPQASVTSLVSKLAAEGARPHFCHPVTMLRCARQAAGVLRRRLVVFLRTKHSGPDGTHTWVFLDDDCDLIRAYLRGVGHHAFTLVYIVLLLPATAAAIAGLVYAAVQHWGDPLVIAFIAAYALAVIVSTRFHSDDHGPIVQAARFCSYLPCWTLPPLWTYYMIEYPSWREDHWTSEEVKHNFEWWVRMWWWLLGVMSNDHPTKHALPMYPPYEWAQKYNAARHMATHLPGVSLTVSNVVVPTDTGFAIVEPYGRSWPWRCLPRVLALVHVSRGEGEDRNTGGYNLLETWVEGRKTWALAVYLAPHIAHSLKDGGWKQLAALPREALRALKEGDLVGLRAPFPSGSPLNDSKFHESALRHQLTAKVVSVDEETMRTLLAIHQLPDVQQLPDVELPAMV